MTDDTRRAYASLTSTKLWTKKSTSSTFPSSVPSTVFTPLIGRGLDIKTTHCVTKVSNTANRHREGKENFIVNGPESNKKCVVESAKAGCIDTQAHLVTIEEEAHSSSPSSLDFTDACKHTPLALQNIIMLQSKPC